MAVSHFNPRSREGSDLSSVKYWLARLISIHAPVKGATFHGLDQLACELDISIHAPVKGATRRQGKGNKQAPISIHAPVKGATTVRIGDNPVLTISIHAPVKGATSFFSVFELDIPNFNPRSREGSDARLDYAPVRVVKFQSTLP